MWHSDPAPCDIVTPPHVTEWPQPICDRMTPAHVTRKVTQKFSSLVFFPSLCTRREKKPSWPEALSHICKRVQTKWVAVTWVSGASCALTRQQEVNSWVDLYYLWSVNHLVVGIMWYSCLLSVDISTKYFNSSSCADDTAQLGMLLHGSWDYAIS